MASTAAAAVGAADEPVAPTLDHPSKAQGEDEGAAVPAPQGDITYVAFSTEKELPAIM